MDYGINIKKEVHWHHNIGFNSCNGSSKVAGCHQVNVLKVVTCNHDYLHSGFDRPD